MERPMQKLNDLSRSPNPLYPDGTLIGVIELSLSSWLVAGIVPGVERQPLKKLAVDESALLKLLHRWREEAAKAGHRIKRIAERPAGRYRLSEDAAEITCRSRVEHENYDVPFVLCSRRGETNSRLFSVPAQIPFI